MTCDFVAIIFPRGGNGFVQFALPLAKKKKKKTKRAEFEFVTVALARTHLS